MSKKIAIIGIIAALAVFSTIFFIKQTNQNKNTTQTPQSSQARSASSPRNRHDYAKTPDEKWGVIPQTISSPNKQRQFSVARKDLSANTQEIVYQDTIPTGQEWYPAGISTGGDSMYLIKANAAPTNNLFGSQFKIERIDTTGPRSTTIGEWYGLPLDIYAQQDRMLLTILDEGAERQTLVLMDMQGKVLKTYYEGFWTNTNGQDLGVQNTQRNIVQFSWAVMSPDAQKALIIVSNGYPKTKCTGVCPPARTDWPAYVLLDLNTGIIKDLNDIPERLEGWADNNHIQVKNQAGLTSIVEVP